MPPFDVASVMKEIDDVSAEDRQVLERVLANSKKLQGGFLRQSEFDRQLNAGKAEIAKAQQDLEARRGELEAEMNAQVGTLADWKNQQEGVLANARTAVQAAEQKVASTRSALERAVTDAGLERETYLELADKEAPNPNPNPNPNPKPKEGTVEGNDRFVDRDSLARGIVGSALTNAEIADLQNEHMDVFGKPLKNVRALVEKTIERAQKGEKGITVRQVWAEEHKVDEAIRSKNDAAIEQRVKDAQDEAYRRGRSEAALGSRDSQEVPVSPVLAMAAGKAGVQTAGVRPGVEAAVKSFEAARATRNAS